MIRQAGGAAPISNRANIVMDRVNGDATRFRWRGVYADLMTVMADQGLDPSVTQLILDPDTDGPCGTLEVIRAQSLPDGTPEVPVDTIELNWFTTEVSIWFSPAFSALSYADKASVIQAVDAFNESGTIPTFTGLKGDAFGHLAIGNDTYKQQSAVFTWTRAVSWEYALGVNQNNMGKVFTPTALGSYVTSRGLTPRLFNISSVQPPTVTPGTAYSLGWLKDDASVNGAANGKALLREQWKYGVYSNVMYAVI